MTALLSDERLERVAATPAGRMVLVFALGVMAPQAVTTVRSVVHLAELIERRKKRSDVPPAPTVVEVPEQPGDGPTPAA